VTVTDRMLRLLGPDRVLSEPLERRLYAGDGGVFRGDASLVVLPRSPAEVQEIVRIAGDENVALVPRGAGTGLAGGAAPLDGAVVVSTMLMNEVSDIDLDDRTAWVGPGVVNLDLSRRTSPHGFHFAPDPSSQQACTIGGNVANNSGGPHCLAEGSTSAHVLGLEAVLADGSLLSVGGPEPDHAGLDLRAVLVGSEGTLGIVTRVLVRLTPNPSSVRTILATFTEVEHASETVTEIIASGVVPAALEVMDRRMVEAVEAWLQAGLPTGAAAVLLAEVTGDEPAVEAEAALVRRIALDKDGASAEVAVDERQRTLWWKARKSAFGAVAQAAPDYYLHDTVVPRTRLTEITGEVYRIGERHGITMLLVLHAGDGNLHPLMAFDRSKPGELERVRAAADELVEACVRVGGVLSGEHGIGLEKRELMPLIFSEASLDAQARIKEAFDPRGRFNPGKVLPAGSRCFDLGRPIPEGVWV
jgi:glycolate oxidase